MKLKQLFSLTILLVFGYNAGAQWKLNDTSPSVICNAPNYQHAVLYATDDKANSYYVWSDNREDKVDLYVQKLDSKGVPQWQANGLKVGKVLDKYHYLYSQRVLKPDGNGGVFVGWHLLPDASDIGKRLFYAQHVSAEGTLLWGESGVRVTQKELLTRDPYDDVCDIVDLKNNELLLFFNQFDEGSGINTVYTKKMDYEGNVIEEDKKLFENNRIENKVIYDTRNNRFLALIKDGQADYLFQSFNADGSPILAEPKVIYQNPVVGNSRIDLFTTDHNGNAVIGRTLSVDDGRKFMIANKVDLEGNPLWGANGSRLGSEHTFDLQVVPTSDGGGIATWLETDSPQGPFLIAKLTATGDILWRKEVFSPRSSKPYFLPNKLQPDGKDGVYTLWLAPKETGFDLTVQHFDSNGTPRFGSDGIAFKDYTFYSDFRVIPYPKGGVIVLWGANKEMSDGIGFTVDLYANYLTETGTFGFEEAPTIELESLSANRFCAGRPFVVSVKTAGSGLGTDNIFRVLISDKSGSFENAVEIGRDIRTTINVRPSQGLEKGTYKLKVVSTLPVIESTNVVEIIIEDSPAPVITIDKTIGCAADTFHLSAVGCDIGSVRWSNNLEGEDVAITVGNTSTFTAACVMPGCNAGQSSNEVLVFINAVNATATNTGPFGVGETIRLNSSGGLKYAWSGPDGFKAEVQNPSISNATLTMGGVYSVEVTDNNNCTGKAQTTVLVNNILALEDEISIRTFPNPGSMELTVEFYDASNKVVEVSMVDLKGQVLGEKQYRAIGGFQKETLDVRYFPSGVYLMKVKTSKQEIVKKVIIEN